MCCLPVGIGRAKIIEGENKMRAEEEMKRKKETIWIGKEKRKYEAKKKGEEEERVREARSV